MATKRRTATNSRPAQRRTTSATKKRTTTAPRRRRRTTKKKGLLSAMSGAEGKAVFSTMVSGAVGGGLYLVYEDQVDLGQNSTPEKKGALALVGAYVLATMGKRPNIAAGITGAAAYDFFKAKGLLNDSASTQMDRMKWADPLQNVPVMLSDDDMYLAQGGNPLALAESGPFADDGQYLPDYAATYNY